MKHGKTTLVKVGAWVILAGLTVVPATALLRARAAAPLPPGGAQVGKNGKPLVSVPYKADVFNRILQPDGAYVDYMTGNVSFEGKGSRLSSQYLTFNETSQIGTSPGALRLEDEQNTLTGNKGVAFYQTRDAKITGNVRIIIRPKPADSQKAREGSARRNFKDPITITCGRVDYNWRTRKGVCTENLVLKQLDRTVTCERMVFDGRAEVVTFEGNVRFVNTKGETGQGPTATLILKEGFERFQMGKGVSGQILVEDEDETPPPADPPLPEEQFTPPVPPPSTDDTAPPPTTDPPPTVPPTTTPPPTTEPAKPVVPPAKPPTSTPPPPRFQGPRG